MVNNQKCYFIAFWSSINDHWNLKKTAHVTWVVFDLSITSQTGQIGHRSDSIGWTVTCNGRQKSSVWNLVGEKKRKIDPWVKTILLASKQLNSSICSFWNCSDSSDSNTNRPNVKSQQGDWGRGCGFQRFRSVPFRNSNKRSLESPHSRSQ